MNFNEVEFTEWQLDKIRVALNSYRFASARNGRPASWECVCDDIKYSEVNIHHYDADDCDQKFKFEALRRFAAGMNVLEKEKLKHTVRYLLHRKFLTLADLEEDDIDLKEMLAAHKYLAMKTKSSKNFITRVEGVYSACLRNFTGMWETFTLRIIADPSKEFVRVAEIYEVSSERIIDCKTLKEREPYTTVREHRTGYGFAVTEDNCLHIFLRADYPVPSAAYAQTGWIGLDCPIQDICLLRHGLRRLSVSRHEVLSDGSVHLFNAFRFLPSYIPV